VRDPSGQGSLGGDWSEPVRRLKKAVSLAATRVLLHTKVTANQISLMRLMLLGPAAASCFSFGTYLGSVLGVLLFNLFDFLDYLDGDLARARGQTSELGQFLDHIGDPIGFLLVLGGLTLGALRTEDARSFALVLSISGAWVAACSLTVLNWCLEERFGLLVGTHATYKYIRAAKHSHLSIARRLAIDALVCSRQPFKLILLPIYAITILGIMNRANLLFAVLAGSALLRSLIASYVLYQSYSRATRSPLTAVLEGAALPSAAVAHMQPRRRVEVRPNGCEANTDSAGSHPPAVNDNGGEI